MTKKSALIQSIKIRGAVIDVWLMNNEDIVIGGFGWHEYNDYLKRQEKTVEG